MTTITTDIMWILLLPEPLERASRSADESPCTPTLSCLSDDQARRHSSAPYALVVPGWDRITTRGNAGKCRVFIHASNISRSPIDRNAITFSAIYTVAWPNITGSCLTAFSPVLQVRSVDI